MACRFPYFSSRGSRGSRGLAQVQWYRLGEAETSNRKRADFRRDILM